MPHGNQLVKILTNNLENKKAVFVTEVAGELAFTERLERLYLIIILLIIL